MKYLLLTLFLLASNCFAQLWSSPQAITNLPEITFRFRVSDNDEKEGGREAEWVFENTADTTVSFIYHLVTDLRDTLSGCVTIEGKRKEYSGWLIRGDHFTIVEGTNVSVTRR